MRKITAILLLITALLLCSCDESEPLAPGESALSDVELDKSEIIEGGWPADLLPEGFPEAPYTEIYSVERKDNEVIIVMFAEFNYMDDPQNPPLPPCQEFLSILSNEYGYVAIKDTETQIKPLVNKQGIRVKFYDTLNNDSYLVSLNSPAGYAYEIRVSKIAIDDNMAYLFWKYPSLETDLGLEEKSFDEWPVDYLPDGFPKPEDIPDAKLKTIKVEQKKTGVFITYEGTNWDLGAYEQYLYFNDEYSNNLNGVYINKSGDYFYIHMSNTNGKKRTDINQWIIQVNKSNDHIIKD